MSAIPQGAFAAVKVKQFLESNQREFREAEENEKNKFQKNFSSSEAGSSGFAVVMEQSPLKYSSKLMNSIWGLYNQYSVHNLKKNKESGDFAVYNNQCM